MKPFVPGAMIGLLLAALISAAAQNGPVISVNDPRPLEQAARQLESKYGKSISYEDVALVYRGDYARALDTDWGRQYAERDGSFSKLRNPIASVGGSLEIPIVVDRVSGTPAFPLGQVLQEAIEQHKARGNPGEFEILTIGDDFAIVPIAARDRSGKMVSVRSPLDYPISFPSVERSVRATIQLICDAVSAASGIKVSGPGTANVLFVNTIVTVGANGEVARDVLVRTLRTMQWRDLALRKFSTIPKISWHLLHGPAKADNIEPGFYALNVRAVRAPEQDELFAAETLWARLTPIEYAFTYTQLCLCPSPQTPGWAPVVFHVAGGVASPITGQSVLYDATPYSTVEKQFGFIQKQIDKYPQDTLEVHVEYDPFDRHPTNVRIKRRGALTSDGDYGFTITNFKRLR